MKFWSNITYQKLSTGNAAEGSLIILKTIILSNQNNYMGLKYSMVKKKVLNTIVFCLQVEKYEWNIIVLIPLNMPYKKWRN